MYSFNSLRIVKFKKNHKSYDTKSMSYWTQQYNDLSVRLFEKRSHEMYGPSRSAVESWISKTDIYPMSFFSDKKKISIIAQWWKRILGLDQINTVISFDACKIDEDLVIDSKGRVEGILNEGFQYLNEDKTTYKKNLKLYDEIVELLARQNLFISNVFIVSICPLECKKCFPIYIEYTNSGSASDDLIEFLNSLPSILRESNINTMFLGSDADPKYNSIQENVFNMYSKYINMDNLNISNIDIGEQIIHCNDPSHILKRIRSRLIKHKTLYSTQKRKSIISIENIKKYDINLIESVFSELI